MEYIKKLAHCTFTCRDYPAMKKFYGEVLGLKQCFTLHFTKGILDKYTSEGYDTSHVKEGDEWISYFEVAEKEYIELFHLPYGGDGDPQNAGFHHVCLLVEDITEAAREFEAKGIQLYDGTKWMGNPYHEPYPQDPAAASKQGQCGSFTFFVQDPEGNEIEIMQYTKDSLQLKYMKA